MPLALRASVAERYTPIAGDLRAMRAKFPEADENALAEKIERRFGKWLGRYICLPLGISQFACIVMAMSVANGIPPVPESAHD